MALFRVRLAEVVKDVLPDNAPVPLRAAEVVNTNAVVPPDRVPRDPRSALEPIVRFEEPEPYAKYVGEPVRAAVIEVLPDSAPAAVRLALEPTISPAVADPYLKYVGEPVAEMVSDVLPEPFSVYVGEA